MPLRKVKYKETQFWLADGRWKTKRLAKSEPMYCQFGRLLKDMNINVDNRL